MTRVLIHIGYPKAGSTYLQTWFGQHPSMLYKGLSVAGFNNTHDIARYAEKNEHIHDHFILSNEDLSAWKGDVDIVGIKSTKIYDIVAYRERLCETLYRIYPKAKILIVTRGFESMFRSIYSQYLSSGGVFTFDELQNEFKNFFPVGYDYSSTIQLYRSKFGKENVIVLPYEMLRENPQSVTQLIEEELGVERTFTIPNERINPSLDVKTLRAYYIVSNVVYGIISPLPYSIQKVVYGLYIQRLIKKKPHPVMTFIARFLSKGSEINVQSDVIVSLKGKAELFKNEPLFQPYLKEYLL